MKRRALTYKATMHGLKSLFFTSVFLFIPCMKNYGSFDLGMGSYTENTNRTYEWGKVSARTNKDKQSRILGGLTFLMAPNDSKQF